MMNGHLNTFRADYLRDRWPLGLGMDLAAVARILDIQNGINIGKDEERPVFAEC